MYLTQSRCEDSHHRFPLIPSKIFVILRDLSACQPTVALKPPLSRTRRLPDSPSELHCCCIRRESSRGYGRSPSRSMRLDQWPAGGFLLTGPDAPHPRELLPLFLLTVAWPRLRALAQHHRPSEGAARAKTMLSRQSARLQSSSSTWSSEACTHILLVKE